MNNAEAKADAMHMVWRSLSAWPSTFSECDCGRGNGRGGGPCMTCAQEALAEAAGEELAAQFVAAVHEVKRVERAIYEQTKNYDRSILEDKARRTLDQRRGGSTHRCGTERTRNT